jgi:hypothetical protein
LKLGGIFIQRSAASALQTIFPESFPNVFARAREAN